MNKDTQKNKSKFIARFFSYEVTHKPMVKVTWAISSAGRATALQAVGHKFEPCIAHQFPALRGS